MLNTKKHIQYSQTEIYEPHCEKTGFLHMRKQRRSGNREADQRLCFRYTDNKTLYYLNPKLQASSHLLCLYSPVCVRPSQKPRRPVFSRGSFNGCNFGGQSVGQSYCICGEKGVLVVTVIP